jgi:transposase
MLTAGIDIGDKHCQICVIGGFGKDIEVVEESRIPTTQAGVKRYFESREPMQVIMEVGTHSTWMSEEISKYAHDVLVANSRKISFIYKADDKNDVTDAEKLARVGHMDPALLYPITHRNESVRSAMAIVHSRDILVKSRTKLISHVRGTVKSAGERLDTCSAERFHKLADELPENLMASLSEVMEVIETLTIKIKKLDKTMAEMGKEQFPETEHLRQVPGVGPVTALAFVLLIGDPELFSNARKVGKYLGLTPKLDESGDSSQQLKITKAGNPYVRSLLVSSAHYILGRFGPDSDLRRYGLRIADRGGKNAKKRAAVAVARKLSVLLLSMWKSGEEYEPLRNTNQKTRTPKLVQKGHAA